jgi:type I restriction enzyme R subunit
VRGPHRRPGPGRRPCSCATGANCCVRANNAFGEFLPSEPRTIVTSRSSTDQKDRIHLATYPAMMQCFAAYDVGFFEPLIIADESHRSIYNRYRDIFSLLRRLAGGAHRHPGQVHSPPATPSPSSGATTRIPPRFFTFDEAMAHRPPYLVPFKVTKVTTGFLSQGIKYSQMTKEQREQLEQQEHGARAPSSTSRPQRSTSGSSTSTPAASSSAT